MKKFVKATLGVTLLEVMLVLAIAAMIIVMSVRYYQSAQAANQANSIVQAVTGVVAASDSLAQASGSYVGTVSTANVQALVPTNSMTTPWGTAMTIAVNSASSYTLTVPGVPQNVCPLMRSKLSANSHFTALTACNAAGTTNFTTTYIANP